MVRSSVAIGQWRWLWRKSSYKWCSEGCHGRMSIKLLLLVYVPREFLKSLQKSKFENSKPYDWFFLQLTFLKVSITFVHKKSAKNVYREVIKSESLHFPPGQTCSKRICDNRWRIWSHQANQNRALIRPKQRLWR